MYDVVLFGGTDEGHKIADFLNDNGINYIVCVATDYGAEILGNKNVRTGRMTAEEMSLFFEENNARLVIDATHPYADKVTENIKKACKCKYIRIVREDADVCGRLFGDTQSAADYLAEKTGNILITTGSKEIACFKAVAQRAYARILPSVQSLKDCIGAGFEPKRIICMQGPFSKDFNIALIRELDIKYLVTKRSGISGGFLEKAEAARETGIEFVVIDRPVKESGLSVSEAEKLILEWL